MRLLPLVSLALVAGLFAAEARAQSAFPSAVGLGGADFSGFSFGVDAGVGLGSAGPTTTSGGIGGAHVGYTLQTNGVVGGVEADALAGSISSNGAFSYSQNFLTSARVKGGLVFGNMMGYGTLGWGWSTTHYSDVFGSADATVKGPVFGAGLEYAMTRNFSLRGEVMHYNFSDAAYNTPASSQMFSSQTTMFRVGASVHF